MEVPWEIRLFFWQAAAVFIFTGWTWIKGWPRFRSIWGLQFKKAMESEEVWRSLHHRVGKIIFILGIWTALPFSSFFTIIGHQLISFGMWTVLPMPPIFTILFIQLPVTIIIFPVAVFLIKRDVELNSNRASLF